MKRQNKTRLKTCWERSFAGFEELSPGFSMSSVDDDVLIDVNDMNNDCDKDQELMVVEEADAFSACFSDSNGQSQPNKQRVPAICNPNVQTRSARGKPLNFPISESPEIDSFIRDLLVDHDCRPTEKRRKCLSTPKLAMASSSTSEYRTMYAAGRGPTSDTPGCVDKFIRELLSTSEEEHMEAEAPQTSMTKKERVEDETSQTSMTHCSLMDEADETRSNKELLQDSIKQSTKAAEDDFVVKELIFSPPYSQELSSGSIKCEPYSPCAAARPSQVIESTQLSSVLKQTMERPGSDDVCPGEPCKAEEWASSQLILATGTQRAWPPQSIDEEHATIRSCSMQTPELYSRLSDVVGGEDDACKDSDPVKVKKLSKHGLAWELRKVIQREQSNYTICRHQATMTSKSRSSGSGSPSIELRTLRVAVTEAPHNCIISDLLYCVVVHSETVETGTPALLAASRWAWASHYLSR